MNGGSTGGELSRRGFLVGTGATLLLAACSGDDGSTAATTTGPTNTTLHTAQLSGDPFGLGVASGDPAADSVILWTRLAPQPLAPDGAGGMPADLVDVRWQVATDDRFTAIVNEGVATADPQYGHSIHVDANGLEPAGDYFYRFTVGEFTSPVGQTRTLPAAGDSTSRLALAVANCQWYEFGYYGAYRHMAEEDLDLVVHLGDYLYEFSVADLVRVSVPRAESTTLPEYRLRYASYKSDADLQAAHQRFPFVCMWDDHDVSNNYLGDTVPANTFPPEQFPERRAAAYQAWWENLPLRTPPPDGPDLEIHQALTFGDLARLTMLDERQFSDVAPCRDTVSADVGDCAERTAQDRTRLGPDQERWFGDTIGEGGVTWDLIGNPVVLVGVDAGHGESSFYLDTWDGYTDARGRLIETLGAADNPVVLTGDYHAGMVLDVNDRPFAANAQLVAPEFMAPPISSFIEAGDVSERTPHLRQQLNANGYLTVVAEPERLTAAFRILDDVADPRSAITTAATWQVDPGDPSAREV